MSKKYHRPPAAKKKKKKASVPRVLEPLPEERTDNSAIVVQDVAPDDIGDDYDDEGAEEESVEQPVAQPVEARRTTSVSHLVTDYGYVVTELRLSIGLAAFLIVSLIIIAIIR